MEKIRIYLAYCSECYYPAANFGEMQVMYSHHQSCSRTQPFSFPEDSLEVAVIFEALTALIKADLN